jgi:hypothetical protein
MDLAVTPDNSVPVGAFTRGFFAAVGALFFLH